MPTPESFEPQGSRTIAGQSCVLKMKFPGLYDTALAKDSALASAPLELMDFQRNDLNTRAEQGEDGMVVVEIEYLHPSIRDKTPDDAEEFSFDTTGGTMHISQKKSLRGWAVRGASPADVQKYVKPAEESEFPPSDPAEWELKDQYLWDGAIGVTPDLDVEGCDVVIPKLALSMRKLFNPASVTTEYIKNLARITGHTNNAAFKGYEAEELLFLGARGQMQGIYFMIEFVFDASENIDNFVIPGTGNAEGTEVADAAKWNPNPIVKKGHDFFWIWYQRQVKDDEKVARPVPLIAYSDRVYDTANFAIMGIGT